VRWLSCSFRFCSIRSFLSQLSLVSFVLLPLFFFSLTSAQSSTILHLPIFHLRTQIKFTLLVHCHILPKDHTLAPTLAMASSTALLPKDRKKDDHVGLPLHHQSINSDSSQPIFLRVCHSPWISIGQKALVGLRSLTASYLFVSFLAIINYDLERNKTGLFTIFKFSNIAYFIQLLYNAIAAVSLFSAARVQANLCRPTLSCISTIRTTEASPGPSRPACRVSSRLPARTIRPKTAPGSASSTLLRTHFHLPPQLCTGLSWSQRSMPP